MNDISQCRFKCRRYKDTSLICNCYIVLCKDYSEIQHQVLRIEIVKNQISFQEHIEIVKGGLTVEEDIGLLKLEEERDKIYQYLKNKGVLIG